MKFIGRLKFLKAFLAYAKDPSNVDANHQLIFAARRMASSDADESKYRQVLDHIYADENAKNLLQTKFGLKLDVSLSQLDKLPAGTLGKAYAEHILKNNLDPNVYPQVDTESEMEFLGYRSFRLHDIAHVFGGYDTSLDGEASVVGFTLAQTKSPLMGILAAGLLLNSVKSGPNVVYDRLKALSKGFSDGQQAQSIYGFPWEDNWKRPLAEVRRELNSSQGQSTQRPH